LEGENPEEIGILDRTEADILEAEDLYSGNIEQVRANYALNQQRGSLGKLVAGGLGLAAGYYLANKRPGFGNRPSSYGYRPNSYGYSPRPRPVYSRPPSYHGYSGRPGYNGYRYRALTLEGENPEEIGILERTEADILEAEDLYSRNIEEVRANYALNQQRGSLGKLVAGGLGLASGYYLANKLSGSKRPSYGYSPYQYGYHGYPSRPSYSCSGLLSGLLCPGGYRPYRREDTELMRTYAIANIIESPELSTAVDYSTFTEKDYGCLPVYAYSLGGVPYFRCKGNEGGPYIQQLKFSPTPYGWSIPHVSNGVGSAVDAYVPVGSI
jgi:hypothetical protein